MTRPRIAFYGDDVTGSVDVLLQFARWGWTGRLFLGIPSADALARAAAECDVVGIAGIARSLPTAELDAEVRPALRALARIAPDIVQYKACSTADSSPAIGSLGRVVEIGREVFGDRPVPLLFAQPDFGRYTAFGHHFAAEGGTVFRLDRQPTMSTHPSTPMTESHLATHLSRQTDLPVGGLPFTAYASGSVIAERLHDAPDAAVVLDALDDTHVRAIGEAVVALAAARTGALFTLGSGGLSRAIASTSGTPVELPHSTPERGPVLVVSGSRSPQTRRQADAAARAGWHVQPLRLAAADRAELIGDALAALASGRSVALTSDDADDTVDTVTDGDLLRLIAEIAAEVAHAAAEAGVVGRIIVCGGDTSSRVTRLLGIESLSIAANPGANVVLLQAHARVGAAVAGLEFLLKGGQVGDDELFERVRGLDV